MQNILLLALAIGAGSINALQLSMLGNIRAERGVFEATWISMLASVTGMAVVLAVISQLSVAINLPSPFDRWWPYVTTIVIMSSFLVVAGRGLPPWLLATGLTSIPYLLAAAYVGPRIGLGVYFAAVVTGQLSTGVVLDHFGAFGSAQHAVDPLRAAGIVVLLIGVVMIRGRS